MNDELTNEDAYGYNTTDNSWSEQITPELADRYMLYRESLAVGKPEYNFREDAARYEFLRAKSASVSIVHVSSILLDRYEHGGIVVVNECDMATANYLQKILHSILDNRGYIDVPNVGRVMKHKYFRLACTCNFGYAGSNEMNEATKSRLGIIRFRYPDSVYRQLKQAVKIPVDDGILRLVDSYYKELKKAKEGHSSSISGQSLNIRGFIAAVSAYAAFPEGRSLNTLILENAVWLLNNDAERMIVRKILDKSIPAERNAFRKVLAQASVSAAQEGR